MHFNCWFRASRNNVKIWLKEVGPNLLTSACFYYLNPWSYDARSITFWQIILPKHFWILAPLPLVTFAAAVWNHRIDFVHSAHLLVDSLVTNVAGWLIKLSKWEPKSNKLDLQQASSTLRVARRRQAAEAVNFKRTGSTSFGGFVLRNNSWWINTIVSLLLTTSDWRNRKHQISPPKESGFLALLPQHVILRRACFNTGEVAWHDLILGSTCSSSSVRQHVIVMRGRFGVQVNMALDLDIIVAERTDRSPIADIDDTQ